MTRCLEWLATLIACAGMCLVMGCAHAKPPCQSYCGMLLEDEGNGAISCDTINKQEAHMLEEIDKSLCAKDPRYCKKHMCEAILGWQVSADDDVIVFGEYMINGKMTMLPAVGLSNCATKSMWLGADQDWRHGSYPHEIFHVIEECDPARPIEEGEAQHGPGHNGWTSMGIYELIEDVRNGRR